MKATFQIGAYALMVLFGGVQNPADAANVKPLKQLSDTQLDKVAAGVFLTGSGNASATGGIAFASSNVTANADALANIDATINGQVEATAIAAGSLRPAENASVTSTLSLSMYF